MHTSVKATLLISFYGLAGVFPVMGHDPEALATFARPHAHEALVGHAHIGWESRYFAEGRDNLDGDSLFFASYELGWKHISGGFWYGLSPDQNYDEWKLSLALTESIGDFEYYVGYTHLQFPFDGSYDNEIGAGVVWSGLPMSCELSADITYSFEAEGFFAEIAVGREFSITDDFSMNVSVPFGINQGFVSDGHDGANHIAFRLGSELALSDSLSVLAHATYSWAIGKDALKPGDEALIDFFHAGVGMQWSF